MTRNDRVRLLDGAKAFVTGSGMSVERVCVELIPRNVKSLAAVTPEELVSK